MENWELFVAADVSIPKSTARYLSKPLKDLGFVVCFNLSVYILFYITAHSLPEITKFLLAHEKANYLLTERFNQDALEIFFGQQRARGQHSDNPSIAQFMENSQVLVVQKSLALDGSSSISRQKRNLELSHLCRPLRKRRCSKHIKFH